jgi:hypothetical protein
VVSWFEPLQGCCEEAGARVRLHYSTEVVVFYLARWCQKEAAHAVPAVASFEAEILQALAHRIVRNLSEDGARVDALVAGDSDGWSDLRGLLMKSAGPRAPERAREYADEAMQKIAVVLLTGTPPVHAADRLREGPDGPRNEYIFTSPFSFWARTVVINLILDERRRERRERARESVPEPEPDRNFDATNLEPARETLAALLDGIRELPPVQRSVMVLSLCRKQIDDAVVDLLYELRPALFALDAHRLGSDEDIAQCLETTTRRVAASRSVARGKLARRDPAWAALLDALLPHRSTRPGRKAKAQTSREIK